MRFTRHRGVRLGKGSTIGPYCVLGVPPKGRREGELPTVIGPGAVIRSHTVIYAGVRIGARFQSGHGALIREETEIGDDCSIGSHSILEFRVKLGNGVRVHSNAFIPEFSVVEDGAWIGPGVIFTNVLHPLCPEVKKCIKGPTIRKGAKIGAGAILMPSVTIGEGALIGAGAVVVKDVPPHTVWAGNPARHVKDVADLGCPWDYIEHPYSNPALSPKARDSK